MIQMILEIPNQFELEKAVITTGTLKLIDDIFIKAKADIKIDPETHEAVKKTIDESSKAISEAMVSNLKKLAELIDVEFLSVLSNIFGDENAESNEKIKLIFKDATEIYDTGESIFKEFEKISSKMDNFWNL